MTAQQRTMGGFWSESNPIPNVQQFIHDLDVGKAERDKQIDEAAKRKKATSRVSERWTQRRDTGSPERRDDRSSEIRPHRRGATEYETRGRMVTDPTTGQEVEIDDVGGGFLNEVKNQMLSIPNVNLGLPTPMHTTSSQPLEEYKRVQDVTAPPDPIASGTTSDVPIHGERTNVLFHPTPTVSFEPMFKVLGKRAAVLCTSIFGAILIAGHISGGRLKIIFFLACGVASAVWVYMLDVIRRGRTFQWHSEKLRGQIATVNLIPESAEWVNSFIGVLWNLANPEMLSSVSDTIEDIMQASLPGIIENVRISEIDQGLNPFRIVSLRSLPDSHVTDLAAGLKEYNKENKGELEATVEEEGGHPYNMECSFAYHAKPSGTTASSKAENMHMTIIFYFGVKGLFGVPFPVFVELTEVVGTIRFRVQFSPEPPFAKNVTFSLMGLPHIRAGCTPIATKRGLNILNLPLISNFVNYAISAAASMYVAPKSMSIDLSMLLGGDDKERDTNALGILWVRIHRARGLSKQDARGNEGGGSDPYINLSFSKYGKPMYCTRVICDNINPSWEEAAALLVTPELVKADEQLSVELWDSDRNTADDIVGKVEMPLKKLMQYPGQMIPVTSKLRGMDVGTEMPGELIWEVGYFHKPKFRTALRTDGKDQNLPESLRDHPALQDERGLVATSDEEGAVNCTPPDPLWPTGICTIAVHQIVNLQVEDPKGTLKDRKGNEYEPARQYGEGVYEEGKQLPSSYCKILLNDEAVYRTRTKAVTSKPIFNAGTERFVRDWRSALVTVTVRDQRNREHDPILGLVPLKLSDILQSGSQVTRWYPLDGGIGYGHIRISLLFRSVQITLPRQMLGYEVGSFQIISDSIRVVDCHSRSKLKLRTSGCHAIIPRSAYMPTEGEGEGNRNGNGNGGGGQYELTGELKSKTRLPTRHRYRSAIIFELASESGPAHGLVWLQNLVDNEDTTLDIPLWKAANVQRLTQNYLTPDGGSWDELGLHDVTTVGRLQFTCRFTPGLDRCHEQLVVDGDMRETLEEWEASVSEGVRGEIRTEVAESVQLLHEKSLVQERDILRQAGYDGGGDVVEDVIRRCMTVKQQHQQQQHQEEEQVTQDGHSQSSHSPSNEESREERVQRIGNKANKRSEHRKQRGLMQWRPARSAVFARDEAAYALRRIRHKFGGDMTGREPDVQTELG